MYRAIPDRRQQKPLEVGTFNGQQLESPAFFFNFNLLFGQNDKPIWTVRSRSVDRLIRVAWLKLSGRRIRRSRWRGRHRAIERPKRRRWCCERIQRAWRRGRRWWWWWWWWWWWCGRWRLRQGRRHWWIGRWRSCWRRWLGGKIRTFPLLSLVDPAFSALGSVLSTHVVFEPLHIG